MVCFQHALRSRPLQPHQRFSRILAAGDAVQVTGGALRGVRGTLVSTNGRDLLVLSIQLLQRSVAVTIDRRWVSAVGTPAPAS